MGDTKGFLKVKRQSSHYRPVEERVKDYREVAVIRPEDRSREQASRCMDCGTPFCHWACPVGNVIPEWNDLLHTGQWQRAIDLLHSTNNLPEITGRLCPALCEFSCVLGVNDDPVTIRENELAIIEHAFREGLIAPRPPKKRTGKKVAVVGSGPAGLAAADQLNKAGHSVTVFEKDAKIGGILRYGIPDFKLDKAVIDRRVDIYKQEGITFTTGAEIGTAAFPVEKILKEFDAVCLTGGSRVPRDLPIEGRNLKGVYFAMDYLMGINRWVGKELTEADVINAAGKAVVVIGGGDTGSDCVGTANRQKAKSVTQIEVMPRPSECRTEDFPWPKFPLLLKTTSSHEEGAQREWAILTKKFIGENGVLKKLSCVRVAFEKDAKGCPLMQEVPGSEFTVEADMVVLAMGFVYPEKGLIQQLGLDVDQRGNIKTDAAFMTNVKKVFAAGDMRRGQSLIVWAISEGRKAAENISRYLSK